MEPPASARLVVPEMQLPVGLPVAERTGILRDAEPVEHTSLWFGATLHLARPEQRRYCFPCCASTMKRVDVSGNQCGCTGRTHSRRHLFSCPSSTLFRCSCCSEPFDERRKRCKRHSIETLCYGPMPLFSINGKRRKLSLSSSSCAFFSEPSPESSSSELY